jgi:NhaA family Na+:H+ antiporter
MEGVYKLYSPLTDLHRRVRTGFAEFLHLQASGSIVLLVATIMALLWANSAWAEAYFTLLETEIGVQVGEFHLAESAVDWINDVLMVLFFLVVGLEIKREFIVGELSAPRKAVLPVTAAVGGMVVPAVLYAFINAGQAGADGWGIPMATDIAFALGVLALLGSRIPASLKIFLTALAIADDIGAVLVIAVFFSDQILWNWLAVAALFLIIMTLFSVGGVQNLTIYILLGIGVWYAIFQSGVHSTLAGVLIALVIPARSRRQPLDFVTWSRKRLEEIEQLDVPGAHVLESDDQQLLARTLQQAAHDVQAPLQRLLFSLHPVTTFLVLPLFAFANAGIRLVDNDMLELLLSPVSMGIILGLVIGKQVGITLFAYLAVKLRLARLPAGVAWKQVYGVSILGGIGFTMSLFIADLAFETNEILLEEAKAAILVASLIAGVWGALYLYLTNPPLLTRQIASSAETSVPSEMDDAA